MVDGTKNGLIFRGPPLTSELWFSSIKPKAADAGTDRGSNAAGVSLGDVQTCILHGLHAGSDTVLDKGVHLARIFAR